MTAAAQRANVREAVRAVAPLALEHELVITHGNGPQVGLLARQTSPFDDGEPVGLDVLGAETEGWIGYVIQQELGNVLPFEKPIATILTMVEVDPNDPAFANPTKPIGPTYSESEARRLAADRGWTIAPDESGWRRVVPSPLPKRIFEHRPVEWLLEKGAIVICAGGGGIPTMYRPDGTLGGAEVVVDKDRATSMLARQLDADCLVLATDVEGVFLDWGTEDQRMIERASPAVMRELELPAGSMGPKVEAACDFAEETDRIAVIGALGQLDEMVAGRAGTVIQG